MKKILNPYYDSDKLGWDQIHCDRGDTYDFDILAFWRTPDGKVYTAEDSGCS